MKNGIVNASKHIIEVDKFKSFTVIGDPGCDGLGAATMSTLAKALNSSGSDFCVIVGDIVPNGSKKLYENVKELIDNTAQTPVYALCGNHDTDYFEDFFGRKEFAVVSPNTLIIMLDNSMREFNDQSKAFCGECLEKYERDNIVIMFHIPPPNSYVNNSVSDEQWEKLREVYLPYKNKIKYFVCGHVHSYFEDRKDDIPLIVTGGGGARIECIHDSVDRKGIKNHVVLFRLGDDGNITSKYVSIENASYTSETNDFQLQEYLESAFDRECVAHFKYKLYAEEALQRGRKGLSLLFKALSMSEYYHAKNHFLVMGRHESHKRMLKNSLANEEFEVDTMYKDYMNFAKSKKYGLSKYTFYDALEAEKVHLELVKEALGRYKQKMDFESKGLYVCSSCGYTFNTGEQPKRCPVCGAPGDKIPKIEFEGN